MKCAKDWQKMEMSNIDVILILDLVTSTRSMNAEFVLLTFYNTKLVVFTWSYFRNRLVSLLRVLATSFMQP